jgi:hypothetical protein
MLKPSGVRSAKHDLVTGGKPEAILYNHVSGLGFDKFRVPLMRTDKAN